jgi:hypothetical protein
MGLMTAILAVSFNQVGTRRCSRVLGRRG